jgi:putative colanic acid biosynthesis acetyltransferase WcaF
MEKDSFHEDGQGEFVDDCGTPPTYIDLAKFTVPPEFRGRSRFLVQLWWLVQDWLIRPSPQFLYSWRRFLWRLFGAEVGDHVLIRPTARVTYPWKVSVGARSWIGDHAELYSLGRIEIGSDTVVSQNVYVCAGTHDYTQLDFPLIARPIRIGDQVWLAAGSFIAPGVTIHRGAIVGARSVVLDDMPPAMICVGYPARPVRRRPDT